MNRNVFKKEELPSTKKETVELINRLIIDLTDVTNERNLYKDKFERIEAYITNTHLKITDFKEDISETGESYV